MRLHSSVLSIACALIFSFLIYDSIEVYFRLAKARLSRFTYFVFVNFISSVYLVLVIYYLVSSLLIQLSVPCGLIVLTVVFMNAIN